jgi:hypothetical protein
MICRRCSNPKELGEFYGAKRNPLGKDVICKECRKTERIVNYRKNKQSPEWVVILNTKSREVKGRKRIETKKRIVEAINPILLEILNKNKATLKFVKAVESFLKEEKQLNIFRKDSPLRQLSMYFTWGSGVGRYEYWYNIRTQIK